ncbi:hypothetical protein Tsubulata_032970 [Turnera subulata]|uniref:Uncharacterized protein n=1 Tax=Turnera subulata TaxID=218843 RepID=A0A9Q0FBT8_9ROSI|nr:hypothetical protein Tsubulata_032970 [Turnera subulata]
MYVFPFTQKYPARAYVCGKPFPQYPKLLEIFGVDRATGAYAETPADAMRNMQNMQNVDEEVADTMMISQQPSPTTTTGATGADAGNRTSSRAANDASMASGSAGGSVGNRKRKGGGIDALWAMTDAITTGFDNVGQNVEKLAAAIMGKDDSRVLGNAFRELGLSDNQVVKVVFKMAKNPQYANYFWHLDDEQKKEFLVELLGA